MNNIEKRTISFSPPDISEAEIAEVAEALRSGWITTGPRTKELERRMAEYCHTKKQVCLNSATAARGIESPHSRCRSRRRGNCSCLYIHGFRICGDPLRSNCDFCGFPERW